ncbi:MAG: L-threonylcarbamoyladenylate synthase [candidate division KSB1 bacterium]|jgi:L-threonylcarbamoyladenylate synthase|nr:L-threonylcarbamoyladenylate synthase [candidate division KSB1 bacterium]
MSKKNPNQMIKIDPLHPDPQHIETAAQVLLHGGVIAYPTETVYGLGANALNENAIDRIFQLKGRKSEKAILIIVHDREAVESLVDELPEKACRLAEALWPGPLTMVFKASKSLNSRITSPHHTIGIRIPDNRICLDLLARTGLPLTSTSANRSGGTNPVRIEDVLVDFGDGLDLYIDGGPSKSNISSTVLDVSVDPPVLRRDGVLSREMIEKIIGDLG